MRKFNLFSRASLASMAAAAGLPAAVTPDDEEDPEAGPPPEPGEEDDDTPPRPDVGGETSADPADAPGDAAAGAVDVVTLADAQAHASAEFAAGRKAEQARSAAVFASAEGKANPAMAAWMLSSSLDASADSIIGQLKTMPAASMQTAALGQVIPDTNVDLGSPAAAAVDAGADGGSTDVWGEVQGTKGGSAPVVAADAGRATLAAISAGARTVSASTPTPAIQPTGN